MRVHRNGGPPSGLPDRESLGYHAQKVVLAELVIDPPCAAATSRAQAPQSATFEFLWPVML